MPQIRKCLSQCIRKRFMNLYPKLSFKNRSSGGIHGPSIDLLDAFFETEKTPPLENKTVSIQL